MTKKKSALCLWLVKVVKENHCKHGQTELAPLHCYLGAN